MNSFEINKILGALLGTCLFLLAMHIASGAIFSTPVPAKPGYEIAVKEEQPAQKQGGAAPAQNFDALLGVRLGAARRPGRQNMPDLPHAEQRRSRQGRPQSLWRRRAGRGVRCPASTIRRP